MEKVHLVTKNPQYNDNLNPIKNFSKAGNEALFRINQITTLPEESQEKPLKNNELTNKELCDSINFINATEKIPYSFYMDFFNKINKDLIIPEENQKELLSALEKRSFINFLRYYKELYELSKLNYIIFSKFLVIDNGILMLEINNKFENITLELKFLTNGKVDFLSMDNDKIEENEKQCYIMRGTLSTSTKLRKSYKMKRLLNVIHSQSTSIVSNVLIINTISYA